MNPSNLMIDSNYSIKLADFGLAQKFSQSMNMMNSFVGTLVYSRFFLIYWLINSFSNDLWVSPEIVQNKPYTQKADIWSLGCILYELLMLKPAFESQNPLMLAKKVFSYLSSKLMNLRLWTGTTHLWFIKGKVWFWRRSFEDAWNLTKRKDRMWLR